MGGTSSKKRGSIRLKEEWLSCIWVKGTQDICYRRASDEADHIV